MGLALGAALATHLLLVLWFFARTEGVGELNAARINLFFGIPSLQATPAALTFLLFASLCPAASVLAEEWGWRREKTPRSIALACLLALGLGMGVMIVAFLHVPYVHFSLIDTSYRATAQELSLATGVHALFRGPQIVVLLVYAAASAWITLVRLSHAEGMPLLVALCLAALTIWLGELWGLLAAPAILLAWFAPIALEWQSPSST